MSQMSDMIRQQFTAADNVRDAGLETPDDIMRYDNIQYGEDSKWQVLDVYRPKSMQGQLLPIIVSVHGGGWVYGDKERYQFYCMNLAQRGFAVVNFTYRLAPEFKYPASLEDTNLVMTWICENADMYGMDLEHVFAVGDSAGAHALGMYSNIMTNPAYAAKYSFQVPKELKLKAVALNCGQYKMGEETEDELIESLMGEYLPGRGTEEEFALLDVADNMTPDFPHTFLMTATGDFLMNQALILTKALVDNSVPFEFHFYGDKENELGHVFHCNVRSEAAKICNDETCAFFMKIK